MFIFCATALLISATWNHQAGLPTQMFSYAMGGIFFGLGIIDMYL